MKAGPANTKLARGQRSRATVALDSQARKLATPRTATLRELLAREVKAGRVSGADADRLLSTWGDQADEPTDRKNLELALACWSAARKAGAV